MEVTLLLVEVSTGSLLWVVFHCFLSFFDVLVFLSGLFFETFLSFVSVVSGISVR